MGTDKRQPDLPADLWTEPLPGRRGPRPRHSRQRILRAAIAIADAGGLAALSMEALATRLGLTPMALYRHVRDKAALVALMIDEGLGPPPRLTGGWRARLTTWSRAMSRVLVAHPWTLEVTARLRVMGPNELAWLEVGMASLAQTRLSITERHEACLAIISVVRTFAQFSSAASLSRARWGGEARRVIAGRDGYPELRALLHAPRRSGGLERAVAWVLDGIASRG